MDLEIKQNNKLIKPIAIIVFLLIAVVIYYIFFTNSYLNINEIDVVKVKKGNLELTAVATGKLESKYRRWISSQVSGIVTRINKGLGDKIHKSEILISLENHQIFSELQSSKSALKILKSELLTEKYRLQNQQLDIEISILDLKSELLLATEKLNAENKLASRGIYSKLDLSRSKSKVEQLNSRLKIEHKRHQYFTSTIDAQLQTKKAKIEELELKIKLKQSQFNNLNITSPIGGVVQEINTETGKRIEVGKELALIVQEYPLIAKIQVNQGSISKIYLGMPVLISATGYEIIGHVSHIAPKVIDGNVEIQVELPTDYPDSLKPQSIISATFKFNILKDILWLPRPNTVTSGQNFIYKVSFDGKSAKKTLIIVGQISNDKIEIIQGLKVNDEVILNVDENLGNNVIIK